MDANALELAEREWVAGRAAEGIPGGRFDLRHLRAIHFHLFQETALPRRSRIE
jgi:cell filamentation protein